MSAAMALKQATLKQASERYNGWYNRETWLVALWLQNDHGLYESTREVCRDYYEDGMFVTGEKIAEMVRELVNEDGMEFGITKDLIGSALARVEWSEIAHDFREGLA